jgi:chromosome partitioning protein
MFGTLGGSKQAPAALHTSGPSVDAKKGHVIVIGNEKGGSGKTTTTMHLIVGLLRLGFSIGSIDIDSRQRSLTRYIENRHNLTTRENVKLPMPQHMVVTRSPFGVQEEAEADERDRFTKAITTLMANNDFVVIDSPGSDTYLSRFAHSFADTIITPINDSFVDLDVLATVDGTTLKIVRPSIYSEMVWEQKLLRAKRDGGSIEWIVMRNLDARNKRFMGQVLSELSRRIGFRAAPGFSERVIFREMFLQGLTVLDVMDNGTNTNISLSHVAARQEVRDLLKVLRIPLIDERITSLRNTPDEGLTVPVATPSDDAATIRPAAQRPASQPVTRSPLASAPPVAQPIGNPAATSALGFTPPPPPPGSHAPAPVAKPVAPAQATASTPAATPAPASVAAPTNTAQATPAPAATPLAAMLNPAAAQQAKAQPAPVAAAPIQKQADAQAPAPTATSIAPVAPTAAAAPAPAAATSVSPAASRPAAATVAANSGSALTPISAIAAAKAAAREGNFLMSSSMLQQAASAIRNVARTALNGTALDEAEEKTPAASSATTSTGWSVPPAPRRELPEIKVTDASGSEREKARDLEAAS